MTIDKEHQAENAAVNALAGEQQSLDPKAARQSGPGDQAKEREAERKARAAQKLRENLMRRKQQARARRAGNADETIGLPAAKTDESSD